MPERSPELRSLLQSCGQQRLVGEAVAESKVGLAVPVAVVDNAPAGCGDTVVAALDLFLSQRYRPATRLGLPVKVLSGSVFSERR